jgi:ABC-2 type transport system ATP-binding protein
LPFCLKKGKEKVNTVEVNNLAKSFGEVKAVRDVTFSVGKGEIFGLLGPNGAGKTTTIRIMLDLFRADAGDVAVLGGPMTEEKKHRIGYMPEERGLYQDVPLMRCLVYLATLKGLSPTEARQGLDTYLERFDLADHTQKKVSELSKGMQQKAQIILTILHKPELVIIDEPFAALDPINTRLVKDVIRELRDEGTTILMSTHQMHQVEELCDRIVLIDEGVDVLYGTLTAIRDRFSGHAIVVQADGDLPDLSGVLQADRTNHEVKLLLEEKTDPQSVLQELLAHGLRLSKFEIAVPTLDEIFIKVVQEGVE